MPDQVWYETMGGTWNPQILPRLVSGETACFVYHPNGRKSMKESASSTFHKTFDDAKESVLANLTTKIEQHEKFIRGLQNQWAKINVLKREDIDGGTKKKEITSVESSESVGSRNGTTVSDNDGGIGGSQGTSQEGSGKP